jgi:DNA anti-recombination protein RmuC
MEAPSFSEIAQKLIHHTVAKMEHLKHMPETRIDYRCIAIRTQGDVERMKQQGQQRFATICTAQNQILSPQIQHQFYGKSTQQAAFTHESFRFSGVHGINRHVGIDHDVISQVDNLTSIWFLTVAWPARPQ